MKDIYIMGIESSCDETSVAIVKNGREVLSNVINTQIKIHEKFGGVVPEIASRCHVEVINQIMKQALEEANLELNQIDAIAVTYGPAKETIASHFSFDLLVLKLLGFICTGFPHPICAKISKTIPNGSIWLLGSRVSLP